MLTATRTDTNDLLRALRNWHPSHHEMLEFFACTAAAIKNGENGLTDKCRAVVVDYCDEATGQIENDLIEQQEETAWRNQGVHA